MCDERKLSDYLHIVGSEQDCPDPFKNLMETLLYSCLSKVGICTQLLFFLVRFSIDFQTWELWFDSCTWFLYHKAFLGTWVHNKLVIFNRYLFGGSFRGEKFIMRILSIRLGKILLRVRQKNCLRLLLSPYVSVMKSFFLFWFCKYFKDVSYIAYVLTFQRTLRIR